MMSISLNGFHAMNIFFQWKADYYMYDEKIPHPISRTSVPRHDGILITKINGLHTMEIVFFNGEQITTCL